MSEARSNTSLNGSAPAAELKSPLGWPRAERPMRIAMLGWARLSAQAKEGSGYNLSCSELARGLSMSGHSVFYLASGMTYRLGWLGAGRMRIAPREKWGGVECFDLLNAPNIAPAAMNFRNMAEEMSSPASTRLVLEWLDRVRAEVVHIHSLEGFGLDLIGAIQDSGRPVIVTPHNYWFACPQVDLLHEEKTVCEDYDGGRRCEGCLPGAHVGKLRRARAVGQTLEYLVGVYPADVVRKLIYGLPGFIKAIARGRLVRRYLPKQQNPDRLVDPELASGFEEKDRNAEIAERNAEDAERVSSGFFSAPSAKTSAPSAFDPSDGLIHHDLPLDEKETPREYTRAPVDQNERILANRDRHLVVLNQYGRRRAAGVAALNRASMVIPPSDYLRKVMVSMGVEESRTRWVRLGQPHFDQINRATRRSPFYSVRPWDAGTAKGPLRFSFFGTTRPNKGLEVLTRAIPLLTREVRQRCHFTIRASGFELSFKKRLACFPEVSVWGGGGYDLLQLIAAGGEYDVGILPHIWLENSPLVLLENLHAGKFVLCSRLGGPVDWVKEPKSLTQRRGGAEKEELGNGLFFPGGDEAALAACITRLVRGEVTLPSPREIHEATPILRSYPGHVAEVEGIYQEVLDGAPRPELKVVVRPNLASSVAASR